MAQDGKPVVVCDLDALAVTDIGTVDALCRLKLVARQLGCRMRVENASDELRDLLRLAGLVDVVECQASRQEGRRDHAMDLNSILIGSEDPKRLTDYYTKLFGKPEMDEGEGGYAGWKLGTGWFSVGPHDQVKGKNAHPGRILWNIESKDVKGDFARLKAAGARVVREPYNPGGPPEFLIATLADPDDNYFQLMSPM